MQDGSPRILALDGIGLEGAARRHSAADAQRRRAGRHRQDRHALGSLGVNIATFALGRRAPTGGSEALALVGLDGKVDASVVQNILGLPSVTDARLVRLPVAGKSNAAD